MYYVLYLSVYCVTSRGGRKRARAEARERERPEDGSRIRLPIRAHGRTPRDLKYENDVLLGREPSAGL